MLQFIGGFLVAFVFWGILAWRSSRINGSYYTWYESKGGTVDEIEELVAQDSTWQWGGYGIADTAFAHRYRMKYRHKQWAEIRD